MNVSILIPIYQRYPIDMLNAWRDQLTDGDQLLVINNSCGRYGLDGEGFDYIAPSWNTGGQSKFMATQFLKHDLVLIADDDIVPETGFLAGLLNDWKTCAEKYFKGEERIVLSVFGRNLGPEGYRQYPVVRADRMDSSLNETDFIGRLYLGHRRNFMVDMQGCEDTRLDDLWWNRAARAEHLDMRTVVMPNKMWHDAESENDSSRISAMESYWEIRDKFVMGNWRGLMNPGQAARVNCEARTFREREQK